jgi:cytochrome c oxidase subunit 1
MPSPSFYPLIVALGLPFLGYAAVFLNVWLLLPGLLLLTFGVYAWALEPSSEPEAAH